LVLAAGFTAEAAIVIGNPETPVLRQGVSGILIK
jgi:hypothetical protein